MLDDLNFKGTKTLNEPKQNRWLLKLFVLLYWQTFFYLMQNSCHYSSSLRIFKPFLKRFLYIASYKCKCGHATFIKQS